MTILEVAGELVEFLGPGQARVASKSTPGDWYAVDANAATCTCKGFQVRRQCRHLQTVLDFGAGVDLEGVPIPLDLATSRYQAHDLIRASGRVPVRITVGRPRFRLAYELGGFVSELAPYGSAPDGRRLFDINDEAEFAAAFRARLDTIGLPRIRARLAAVAGTHEGRGLVLLCYEDLSKPEEWCHRRVFASWWQDTTQEEVPEL